MTPCSTLPLASSSPTATARRTETLHQRRAWVRGCVGCRGPGAGLRSSRARSHRADVLNIPAPR
eukprot:5566634-Alexandrium_andersonii.AAC.1